MYLYVKLNRDDNCFLPIESKDCINSASEYWFIIYLLNIPFTNGIPKTSQKDGKMNDYNSDCGPIMTVSWNSDSH